VRVLIVEDEKLLADVLAKGLRDQRMAVDVAYEGERGLDLATANQYDVIVLDRNLPGITGDDICRELAGGETRILMLTASSTITDRVEGLNIGADDYLAKPFAFEELVARVQALARRVMPALPPVLSRSGVSLDRARHRATRNGRDLSLTRKEFTVLEVLVAAQGAVVSADGLLEKAWDDRADPLSNVVRIVMSNLRRKLGDPPIIQTVPGVGYRL
jgi:DNA-binding response OmpR family regulator